MTACSSVYVSPKKETKSIGNQVWRTFWRTQWERILFVCYEGSRVDLAPNITQSCEDHRWDTLSVDHLWEIHDGILQTTHGYQSRSPSFPPCCVVRYLKTCCLLWNHVCFFFEKKGKLSRNCWFALKRCTPQKAKTRLLRSPVEPVRSRCWLEDGGGLPVHWVIYTQCQSSVVTMGTWPMGDSGSLWVVRIPSHITVWLIGSPLEQGCSLIIFDWQ